MARRDRLEGAWLVAWAGGVAAAASLAVLATVGATDAGLRTAIRMTARWSLLLFLVTFAASSVNSLRPGPGGKWMLRNRKFLGNGFAASHAVHGALIVALAALDLERLRSTTSDAGLYGGLFGYIVLAAMVVTSFKVPTRWLGRGRWRVLHKAGMYVFFGIFFVTYAPVAAAGAPVGITAVTLLIAVMALRIAAGSGRRSARSAR